MLTCISQKNHKLYYTSAFSRFYQDLIVETLVSSLSILILIIFWIGITLASSEGKTLVEKRDIKYISHLQWGVILQQF